MEENRKGPGIFYAVVGVATLVVAIIGATFAYFSATTETTYTDEITGGTNDDLAGALSLSVERVRFGLGGTAGDNVDAPTLVPANLTATKDGVNNALTAKCMDGSYTGCHVYKITAGTEQDLNVANIYLELNAPDGHDKGNWKYLVFTGSETEADEITTAEATFSSTNVEVADGIRGTDIHTLDEKKLTAAEGQTYYVMVYLANLPGTAQNAGDTADETGTYTGTVSIYAAGGKVSASFGA